MAFPFLVPNITYLPRDCKKFLHSNAIEGNTLSYAETYAIIFNDNTIPVTAKPRELYEAVNLKYAMNYVLERLEKDLSSDDIIQIAILINKNINEISGFRKNAVFIHLLTEMAGQGE